MTISQEDMQEQDDSLMEYNRECYTHARTLFLAAYGDVVEHSKEESVRKAAFAVCWLTAAAAAARVADPEIWTFCREAVANLRWHGRQLGLGDERYERLLSVATGRCLLHLGRSLLTCEDMDAQAARTGGSTTRRENRHDAR